MSEIVIAFYAGLLGTQPSCLGVEIEQEICIIIFNICSLSLMCKLFTIEQSYLAEPFIDLKHSNLIVDKALQLSTCIIFKLKFHVLIWFKDQFCYNISLFTFSTLLSQKHEKFKGSKFLWVAAMHIICG